MRPLPLPTEAPEWRRDALRRLSFCHQGEHLAFPVAENGERVVPAADRHQILDQRGVHDRGAIRDSSSLLRNSSTSVMRLLSR